MTQSERTLVFIPEPTTDLGEMLPGTVVVHLENIHEPPLALIQRLQEVDRNQSLEQVRKGAHFGQLRRFGAESHAAFIQHWGANQPPKIAVVGDSVLVMMLARMAALSCLGGEAAAASILKVTPGKIVTLQIRNRVVDLAIS